MVGIILASHGNFASGIKQSGEMIFGDQKQFTAVTFQPSEGPEDLRKHLEEAIDIVGGPDSEILFLVDLWGGSPFNQANILFEEHPENFAIVAGLNLPMLLEALGQRMMAETAHDVAKAILTQGRDGVKVRPEDLEPKEEAASDSGAHDDAAQQKVAKDGRLPEGTVLGDGKIKYALARIDTRLLHGQVSTNWAKYVNPNRIIVVSDSVSKDKMRKTLIQQAAPAGMHANVIPVKKLAEIDKDPRFGSTKALLLFETPQDVLEALEAGVKLPAINVGSMAHSQGKTMLTNAVSIDDQDVKDFHTMMDDYDMDFYVQKVPADKSQDLKKLLDEEAKA
ncbi:MAG: PTS sugar transporter subunit IIB [Aerococcus sp.]|nr:PTS sugar transporter subunit IIB [Aerococcus sp.]MDO4680669.1 PTS sugar transporter subunit IIB [Aerococcus sp.]